MIGENITKIRQQIAEAAERKGRNPAEIELLAVSKRIGVEKIREAYQNGQLLFGENYIQEAVDKIDRLGIPVSWHFIGHLQRNKAKLAAEFFQMVETVDRLNLARALNTHAETAGKTLDILVQINVGGEKQKSGVNPGEAEQLLDELKKMKHLSVRGLMTMPPFFADPEKTRPYFRKLRKIAGKFSRINSG